MCQLASQCISAASKLDEALDILKSVLENEFYSNEHELMTHITVLQSYVCQR